MIFNSFFYQLPKHAFKNLLILLSFIFILSLFFSIRAFIRNNIIFGTMIIPICGISLFLIIITLLHYFKTTPQDFEDSNKKWKEDLAKAEKEKKEQLAKIITPNHIPFEKRLTYLTISIGLLVYGTLGL